MTRSVAPLKRARARPETDEGEFVPPAKTSASSKARSATHAAPARITSALEPLPALAPLDRRQKKRLARGSAPIDMRLDLHGCTQSEAHAALLHFLRRAQRDGARIVLVITGKGRLGGGIFREVGVLRRQVPQWLRLAEFRPYVTGFEDAHIAHGGEGALYVRVRRGRSD